MDQKREGKGMNETAAATGATAPTLGRVARTGTTTRGTTTTTSGRGAAVTTDFYPSIVKALVGRPKSGQLIHPA